MPQDVKAPKSERSRDRSDVVDHVGGQLIERAGATFGPAHVHRDHLVSGGRQGMHQLREVGDPAREAREH
jgi:hypothetical protein